MIDPRKLDFYMENNLNVLMEGSAGVGKSTTIIEAAERNNLNWMYFSAATMDPFTDFVGTPYKAVDEKGVAYIDFVRPRRIQNDEVEFMFFDEFNRAKPKIRNAVMELIQFKSINGHKFKNLRMIWAAINPEHDEERDEDYNVEKLDPAEKDRFHIQIVIPSKADKKWFQKAYGEQGGTAVQWWNALDQTIRNKISPRRLDYAMHVYRLGGDVADVLPRECNIGQLVQQLATGSYQDRLRELIANNDHEQNRKEFGNENFYVGTFQIIINKKEWLDYFSDFYPDEKWNSLIVKNPAFRSTVLSSVQKIRLHAEKIQQIVEVQSAKREVINELREALKKLPINEQPGVDPIITKYNQIGDVEVYGKSELRTDVTGIIMNCNFENMDLENLKKAFAVNAYIGGRTNSEFWVDTKKIFDRIDIGAKKHNTSLMAIFKEFKNDPLYKAHYLTNGIEKRLERRFDVLGYM